MHAASHPMANPGYGKRSAAGQPAPSPDDFALLPGREAAIAGFIDRLPDGADISVKALAKVMEYGQCALRTALNFLERAGHLLRRREFLAGDGGGRWVTRTWFSRTAREGDAWETGTETGAETRTETERPDFLDPPNAGACAPVAIVATAPAARPMTSAAPAPASTPTSSGTVTSPALAAGTRPPRSRAYLLLASLGRRCPDLSLSAADCTALETLTAAWFARGAGEEQILGALTYGLPAPVHHPAGLVRSRLTTKLPPEPPGPAETPVASGRARAAMVECVTCRAPGRPEALADGKCRTCRSEDLPAHRPAALPPDRVHALATEARNAATR
ncbi:hypothetical protein AB0O07_17430 [Streptomyces sp. NPDC093085]|uniref:hypothetical protein n=1 Tax=Streptomyces sp. NPDC093085 TaxID=3155068 RepID=UPI003426F6E3